MPALTINLKVIVGLGNPGEKYSETRHNAGFWFVDEVSRKFGCSLSADKKFFGEVGVFNRNGSDIRLLTPDTFMNRSGQAVRSLLSFYKIKPEECLVAHDEIDLPPGDVRLKFGGGHGGHNGLRDIISQLGTKDFHRLRIGVGRPQTKEEVVDYVLRRPSKDDRTIIDDSIYKAVDVVPLLVEGTLEIAMQQLHTKVK